MIKRIDLPIYKCSVILLVETTREEWKKFFEKHKPKITEKDYVSLLEEYNLKTPGVVFGTEGNDYLCYISNKDNFGLAVHELFHLANFLLCDRGYKPDDTSEPIAYLLEYLVNQYINWLENEKE